MGLFQADGPYHRDLHDLLAAYVSFQPSIGYLQGMSFIAAILILVMGDILAAFIAFVSILNRDSYHAFYSLDECEVGVFLLSHAQSAIQSTFSCLSIFSN
ncbi:unnamed protein product [Dibothriocephalus latus]|uniref:Rab-GAP TBC domain-containing protein n=1 Tax=Dibothriocephalus latus TaxID=60516 RepID=A0A3P7MVJ9_DIBLA|nr:unnamed protein product [Dibothriocephalus latus]